MSDFTFKIEKDVARAKVRQGSKYRFGDMEIDDSFLTPHELGYSARAAAYTYGRCHGKKFATETVADGLRIFRVA